MSNPPYFEDSLKNPDAQRTLARHTDSLKIEELTRAISRLMTADGTATLILPADQWQRIKSAATLAGLFVASVVWIKTTPRKQPKRMIVELVRQQPEEMAETTRQLMNADGSRSDWYQEITRDFYIK